MRRLGVRRRRTIGSLALVGAMVLAGAACSGDDADTDAGGTTTTAPTGSTSTESAPVGVEAFGVPSDVTVPDQLPASGENRDPDLPDASEVVAGLVEAAGDPTRSDPSGSGERVDVSAGISVASPPGWGEYDRYDRMVLLEAGAAEQDGTFAYASVEAGYVDPVAVEAEDVAEEALDASFSNFDASEDDADTMDVDPLSPDVLAAIHEDTVSGAVTGWTIGGDDAMESLIVAIVLSDGRAVAWVFVNEPGFWERWSDDFDRMLVSIESRTVDPVCYQEQTAIYYGMENYGYENDELAPDTATLVSEGYLDDQPLYYGVELETIEENTSYTIVLTPQGVDNGCPFPTVGD